MLAGVAALLSGMYAGLVRMGWMLPGLGPGLAALHGPLMVCGFVGTLVCVERTVGMRQRVAILIPILAALGMIGILAGVPAPWPAVIVSLASAGLIVAYATAMRLHGGVPLTVMALGGVAWLVGNLHWLAGVALHLPVGWWMGFLVLTVAGERLELSRMANPPPSARRLFTACVVLFCGGLTAGSVFPGHGHIPVGIALAALALWLFRFDIARRTIRSTGLPRFVAASLLSGYAWLLLGGAVMAGTGGVASGMTWDIIVHSVFVGFVFSMIFGHAPIIFPAVLGVPVHYRPLLYAPLALLHLSLIVRVAGDLAGNPVVRRAGGLLDAAAIILYLAMILGSALAGRGRAADETSARG
jgi:hypothetical protein